MHPADSPPPFSRREGRSAFDGVAASYADARPPYPERVYEILQARCGLAPGRRVLEIGAGSGQATHRLVAAGAHVVVVEPSRALADQLRARLATTPSLEVVVAPFEDADLPSATFDLVAAATSFHWLETGPALAKIAHLLQPAGWVALWWNVFGDPERPDPFHDATRDLLRGLEPSPSEGSSGTPEGSSGTPFALDVEARVADLGNAGFEGVEHESIRWTLRLDPPGTRRLYATYSNIARLPEGPREAILDEIARIADVEFGGRVERQMVTPVYTAQRPAGSRASAGRR